MMQVPAADNSYTIFQIQYRQHSTSCYFFKTGFTPINYEIPYKTKKDNLSIALRFKNPFIQIHIYTSFISSSVNFFCRLYYVYIFPLTAWIILMSELFFNFESNAFYYGIQLLNFYVFYNKFNIQLVYLISEIEKKQYRDCFHMINKENKI